jgi:hypothetical protein
MVDTNCAWTPAEAEAAVAAMAPYKPFWVEEPIYPPEDFEALAKLRTITGVPMGIGENATSLREFRRMVTIGKADYVQPAMVKLGITAMAKVAAEVEQAGATCVPNAFYLGPAFLAVLHCLAAKEKDSPLERMFADFGATPFAKTVPIINGEVEVPQGPGLGADPEDDLVAQFRVCPRCATSVKLNHFRYQKRRGQVWNLPYTMLLYSPPVLRLPASFNALSTFSGLSGKVLMRTPVALKIALAMAAMGGTQAISPAPLAP